MQLASFHLATEYKSPMGILEPAGESDAYIYIHTYINTISTYDLLGGTAIHV